MSDHDLIKFTRDGVDYLVKRTIYGKYTIVTDGKPRRNLTAWTVISLLVELLNKHKT